MSIADLPPVRSIVVAAVAVVATIVTIILGCIARTSPPRLHVVQPLPEQLRSPCLAGRGTDAITPIRDERGGYFVTAVVVSVRQAPISDVQDHVALCVVEGDRIGVTALSVVETEPFGWQPGMRVLAHVIPGNPAGCRVPRGSSLFYLECARD